MHIIEIQKAIQGALERSIRHIAQKNPPKDKPPDLAVALEVPKDDKHGDLTTNIAMCFARYFSMSGVDFAHQIKDELDNRLKSDNRLRGVLERIDVLKPGFINFWLSKEELYGVLEEIRRDGGRFGENKYGKNERVNAEFVSANPTGPLTVAHGRQAAIGDALGRILEFSGYRICREYFINDVGVQIELLARSIHCRYAAIHGIEHVFPEDGYYGEYIKTIARTLNEKYGNKFIDPTKKNLSFIAQFGVKHILKNIEDDLKHFGVCFDVWFSQKKLSRKTIRGVLDKLKAKNYVYEKDQASWFRSTAFGDDKDRVVVKTDGTFTYLAPDIAYHRNKYKRGFNRLIDVWGPDHHGYIPRLTASVEALGYDRKSISILIVQLATLFRNGIALSMSTRKGEFITLKEVVDEVGSDVAKFFFLMRKTDSHLDFDLEVAKRQSLDNPVYYIQYAHARIWSIIDFSSSLKNKLKGIRYDANLLSQPEELLLLRVLCRFPFVIEASATALEPYRVVDYISELAKVFHGFYTKHRVVSEEDLSLTKARLELVDAVRTVLATGLKLLGISLPTRM